MQDNNNFVELLGADIDRLNKLVKEAGKGGTV